MGRKRTPLAAIALALACAAACASPVQTTDAPLPAQDLAKAPPAPVYGAAPPPAPPPPLAPPPPGAALTEAAQPDALGRVAVTAFSNDRRGMARRSFAPNPMRASPRDTETYPDTSPNPVKAAAQEPVSTFSIDVDTASYSNVRRFLNDGTLPPRDAVRVEELLNYFDYDYPLPKDAKTPFRAQVAMAPSPWGKGKTLLHIGLQGYDVAPAQRPPLNLTLLIDVSGSMNPPDRLPLAKKVFEGLVGDLTEKDKLAIVVYAGAAGAVLEPTSGADRGVILAALSRLQAGGSTAGGEGLALAYTLAERNFNPRAVNRVIIATDGDFNVGVSDPARLEDFVARKRASGIYLSVLGFGRGNYQDALMQKLAQSGNGAAAYIDTLNEGRKVLHDQMQSALLPIADDVKIQVEFNPARVAEYRLIGYETRALKREDFANDRVDAGEIGAGASVTALYELTPPGGATLFEPLRYGPQGAPAAAGPEGQEVAFLRIRYKRPGAQDSLLIEQPIQPAAAYPTLDAAPEATRFAAAVAGYGQVLRGDPYLDKDFGLDQVIAIAAAAKGQDPFGWRSEFVQLARAAKTAKALPDPEAPPGPPDLPPRPRPR